MKRIKPVDMTPFRSGVLCSLLLLSCEFNLSGPGDIPGLTGPEWTLQFFVSDGKLLAPPQDQSYSILFETDSTCSGLNDCNAFMGEYQTGADQSIDFSSYVATEIYCGNTSWDSRFYSAMQSACYYAIKGRNLLLKDDQDVLLMFETQE
ncbi:MAG: META domain-containing protein [candidate division KSB1 bacterium]|nr:META domain-containing protein [candidate division KSB1 bacterium]